VGIVGFVLKNNLDRVVATHGFNRSWGFISYWIPVEDVPRITALPHKEAVFLATMVALALPFIWLGVTQTLKRLRSAQLPLQLVLLFFVPFLNLLFFLLLCLIPEREPARPETKLIHATLLSQIVPESALGSAAISLLLTVPVGLGMVELGARVLRNYGWGMFVALPFTVGFAAALVYGVHEPRSAKGCVGVACLAALLWGGGLLGLAWEGMVCLIMAMPIALPLAALGGACGYFVQRRRRVATGSPAFLSILLLFVPGVQWTEHVIAAPPPSFAVRSSIDVQAPPEKVWKQVIAFSEIPAPKEWMFRAGIAYPIRAEMVGSGPGAERHCVFSTGAFVEPIQIWDEPHRLKFSVTSNPPPMEEWTPYPHIDPPHLHGFMVSNGGQFLLTPLPNGGTRLEGTTWYRHGLWPVGYWRLWSDAIIHRIHMRVLTHIRDEVEKQS
jgi:hypothetical protein